MITHFSPLSPGGGKDLATVATLTKIKTEVPTPASSPAASNVSSKASGKIPAGLIKKAAGSYEVIKQPTILKQPGVGSSGEYCDRSQAV